jgi:hypothetical protein
VRASKYSLELVDPSGQILADLSGRAAGRSLVMSRNEAEEITWSIDLNEFERYCRLIGTDPKVLLVPNQTEVRIKRGETYLAAGQIVYIDTHLTASQQTISVRAHGFLNLFKYRFTGAERIFTATERTEIARTLIAESQAAGDDYDFGIVAGPIQATVGPSDRTYRRTNIKDALQNLTDDVVGPFDFEFTYDKKFNTYSQIGSQRPEIIFEYPGNIRSIRIPNDATGMANHVTALGSGFGALAAISGSAVDLNSIANYKLRQKIITPNSVEEQDTLEEKATSEVAAWAFPFEVPALEVDGNVAPFVTDYRIGDYVRARVTGHPFLSHIDAMFRIEKLTLTIDEEDNERIMLQVTR